MEETISIKEIYDILKKHLKVILLCTVIGGILAGMISFLFITPKYSSQTQLIVTLPKSETTNVNDVNTNLQMINTYKDLITGDLVMSEVSKQLEDNANIEMTEGELREVVEVTQSQNSQMFSIKAVDANPKNAKEIANTTAEVFKDNAKDVMSVDKISIISEASASEKPVSPNNKLIIVIGLVLGALLGIVVAFVFQLFDRTVKDDKFIIETLDLTILGSIPLMDDKEVETTLLENTIVKEAPTNDLPKEQVTTEAPRRSRARV
ncbi:MAG: YveK family protein [Enterococcus sp.]